MTKVNVKYGIDLAKIHSIKILNTTKKTVQNASKWFDNTSIEAYTFGNTIVKSTVQKGATKTIKSIQKTVTNLQNLAQTPKGQAALFNGSLNAAISCSYDRNACDAGGIMYNAGVGAIAGMSASPASKPLWKTGKQAFIYSIGSYGNDIRTTKNWDELKFNHKNAFYSGLAGGTGAWRATQTVKKFYPSPYRDFMEAYMSGVYAAETNKLLNKSNFKLFPNNDSLPMYPFLNKKKGEK